MSPIFQPSHLAFAQAAHGQILQTAQRHLLRLLRRSEAGTNFADMRGVTPSAETLVGLAHPADSAVRPGSFFLPSPSSPQLL